MLGNLPSGIRNHPAHWGAVEGAGVELGSGPADPYLAELVAEFGHRLRERAPRSCRFGS